MSAQPAVQLSLDPRELAAQILDWRGYPSSDQYVNELLRDVRPWRKLELAQIEQRLDGDPLAIVAAWELALSQELTRDNPSDVEFVARFADPAIIRHMVHVAADVPGGLKLPQALASSGGSVLELLGFLRNVLRWAQRFGPWSGEDLQALQRLTLRGFPRLYVPRQAAAQHELLMNVIARCGISSEPIPPGTSDYALWLTELLGLRGGTAARELPAGELREAGGTENSLYVVRAIGGVDGFDVRGIIGPDLGLIIDIGDREVSAAATAHLEQQFAAIINEHTPLLVELHHGNLKLRWQDPKLEAEDLGRIIHAALKSEFMLGTISVNIIFDPLRISSLRPGIYSYREERDKQLKRRSEDNSPLVACRACNGYAPQAFCMVSPDRPPPCGRSYDEMAMLAQLTPSLDQFVVERGITRDRSRTNFVGMDKAAAMLSRGAVTRLHMHGLREHPQPLTAIPQCIAYAIEELEGVAVVSRDYAGRTPDGKTFEGLLARLAGRQAPGCAGISEEYIVSPRFLAGEGGLARVAWMNSALKERLKIRAEQILTELDCTSLAALKEAAAAWRR